MNKRFYNPETNTEVLPGLHDLTGAIASSDMPPEAKEWFTRPAKAGFQWKCRNGKWPEEVLSEPSTSEELASIERQWRNSEIGLTDRVFVADYGPVEWTAEDRKAAHTNMMEYRNQLKQWPVHPEFPNSEHRPVWPETVPRPAV